MNPPDFLECGGSPPLCVPRLLLRRADGGGSRSRRQSGSKLPHSKLAGHERATASQGNWAWGGFALGRRRDRFVSSRLRVHWVRVLDRRLFGLSVPPGPAADATAGLLFRVGDRFGGLCAASAVFLGDFRLGRDRALVCPVLLAGPVFDAGPRLPASASVRWRGPVWPRFFGPAWSFSAANSITSAFPG